MHHLNGPRGLAALLVAAASASCGGGEDAEPSCIEAGNCELVEEDGDEQSGTVGELLPRALEVRVVDADLVPVADVEVTWTVVEGGGGLAPEAPSTDAEGFARATATLGTVAGSPQVFEAVIDGLPTATVRFTATARVGRAARVLAISGADQVGPVGDPLPAPFVVQVTDAFDNPVEGFAVQWTAVAGGGSIEPATSMTDASGQTSAVGTLGRFPSPMGEQGELFRARAEGVSDGSAEQVDFFAAAVAGPPAVFLKEAGDGQGGIPGSALPDPLVIRITDRFGNPVDGVQVAFSADEASGASIEPAMASTDEEGLAEARAVLGDDPGDFAFEAASDGLPGSPLTFDAVAFPPICSQDGWCWQSPLPQGNTLNDVYADGSGVLWAVGSGGAILRFNGAAWEAIPSNTASELRGVHGAGSTLVAVGDDGTVARWNGSTWTPSTVLGGIRLTDVWLASASEGWAVGEQGTILRFDGQTWSPVQTPTNQRLNGIFGTSASDVWAVGERGTVIRYDGTTWAVQGFGLVDDLNGVWGSGPSQVFFVGDFDGIYGWNGTESLTYPANSNQSLRGVFGTGPSEAYAFGDSGRVRRWDGSRWRTERSRTVARLNAMAPFLDTFLAVGEDGVFATRENEQWVLPANRRLRSLQGIWGDAPDSAWAVGDNGNILRWTGQAWDDAESPVRTNLIAVTGTAADDVWAVGDFGTILHYDGAAWSQEISPTPEPLLAVWPLSATDVWAVGNAGTIIRYDGDRWRAVESGVEGNLYGVYGASSDQVWAVGDDGAILEWSGDAWRVVESPTEAFILGVRGSARDHVWAWGSGGVTLLYDGVSWTEVVNPTTRNLIAIWPFSETEAIAVGEFGTIMSRTSLGNWRREVSGAESLLSGVWGASPSDVWIVGASATILRKTVD